VRRLTRTTAILSGCIVAALLLAGPSVMHKWSRGLVAWNPLLAALMGANVLIQAVTGVSATALGSLGVARDPALLVVFQAILNVFACFWLIRHFGVVGGACGSLVAYAITSGWYVPWRLRQVGRNPRSARVPPDPLIYPQQADEGVGCGPWGPPHAKIGPI
jgi:Na+-driven multidrug efflux pump